LKRLHAKYLESSRNIQEGRLYWSQAAGPARWILQLLSPVPLLSLDSEGGKLLQALEWLEAHCRGTSLQVEVLRNYHRLLRAGHSPGEYRKGRADVLDSKIPRPDISKIPALMKQLDLKLSQEQARLDQKKPDQRDVMQFASEIHQRIAFIHPFEDGNGRVARLAVNHLLRRYGAGYVILPPVSDSSEHFRALEEAHRGNLDELTALSLRFHHPV
jgi:Fic family protein